MESTQWNLNDIYKDEEEIKKDCDFVLNSLEKLKTFKGKLNNAKFLYDFLNIEEQMSVRLQKIYSIRFLKKDEKTDEQEPNKKIQEIEALYQKISEELVFVDNEILENDDEFFETMYDKEPGLVRYKISLDKLKRQKKHILSKEVEEALTAYGRILDGYEDAYDTLIDTDLKFDDVVDSKGNSYSATNEKLSLYLHSKDPVLRKSAFDSRYKSYGQFAHTITKLYLNNVRIGVISSKMRKYKSCIEALLNNRDSNINVYDSVIKTVNDNLYVNHRYFALRKKLLGVGKMYHYDNFAPLIKEVEEKHYTYEEGVEIILKALQPLGKKYIEDLTKAFKSNWSDVFERDKKRSGAYSYGVYGVHPFVLQNFNGTLGDVSTIAHEFGHAMHSYYASLAQQYPDHNYTIMAAEVASTVNETLLMEYLINNETDLWLKATYILEQLKDLNSTLVRQTMFAEFEKWIYEQVGNDVELTCEEISDFYLELVNKYFGDALEESKELKYEWARIPHFYSPFYVYQYSTGIASAICIVSNIFEKGEEYSEKYLEMLAMGGSKKPLDELRYVDVDLETDVPVKKAFEFFNKKIDDLESIMKQIKEKEEADLLEMN